MQSALKDIFGPLLEEMLEIELDNHLGYEKHNDAIGFTDNRRNGSTPKKVHTSVGQVNIDVPRDRDGSFEPEVVPKRQKDITDVEEK